MNRQPVTTRAGAMRESHRHYRSMTARHEDWSYASSLRISWSKHRADVRTTDRLMSEIAKTIGRHLAAAMVAAALSTSVTAASAQVQNESGWSESNTTGETWGQTRDGTSWREQSNGYGGSTYSDTSGRNCWTESSAYGGQFTSCR